MVSLSESESGLHTGSLRRLRPDSGLGPSQGTATGHWQQPEWNAAAAALRQAMLLSARLSGSDNAVINGIINITLHVYLVCTRLTEPEYVTSGTTVL